MGASHVPKVPCEGARCPAHSSAHIPLGVCTRCGASSVCVPLTPPPAPPTPNTLAHFSVGIQSFMSFYYLLIHPLLCSRHSSRYWLKSSKHVKQDPWSLGNVVLFLSEPAHRPGKARTASRLSVVPLRPPVRPLEGRRQREKLKCSVVGLFISANNSHSRWKSGCVYKTLGEEARHRLPLCSPGDTGM